MKKDKKKPAPPVQPAPNAQDPNSQVVTFGFEVAPMPTLVVDKPPLKIEVPKEIVEKIVEKLKDL